MKLTPRQTALIHEALQIEQEEAREADAVGFMARTLAQVTMPHTDPVAWNWVEATDKTGKTKLQQDGVKDLGTLYYKRTSGQLTLSIRGHETFGVPFGTLPRAILAWMCTEAVQKKSRELVLGRSASEFAQKVGLTRGGRDLNRLKNQCLALARAVISIDARGESELAFEDVKIASRGFLFWGEKNHDQPSLWESTLTLTEDFYKAVVVRPVPIDLRVYHALSKSPLAMDIYTWLTYRMFILRTSGKTSAQVPWCGLAAQFGGNYADSPQGMRDFKKAFRKRLNEVLQFYPEARNHIEDGGEHLLLTPCRLHIQHTGSAKLSKI